MGNKLTTSENALGGEKLEKLPEMSAEEKAAQKEADKKVLESYNVQIDQLELEIPKLEEAIKLNLPEREVKLQVEQLKEQLEKFRKFRDLVQGRNK